MSESALAKKRKLKPGVRAAIIGAPEGYATELEPLPAGVELKTRLQGKFDWIQIFARTKGELAQLAPRAISALKAGGLLWISFPKGSSKQQADLTRDTGWEMMADSDLKWVNLISVNTTWSAFAMRPYKQGEERQSFR